MKLEHLAWFGTLLLVGAVLVGCGTTPAPAATATPATYTDPFAYCAAVDTVDTPGPDYVGPQAPESVAQGLRQALNAPDTPIDVLQNGSFWRCMDGSVYACFVGANLPCEAKANTDRTPTQEEVDYCQQNPDSDFIPAVVTGRETVYEWRCLDGVPDIEKQLSQPDAQGFFSDIWYKISPNAATGATTGPTPPPPTALPQASAGAQIVFGSNRGGIGATGIVEPDYLKAVTGKHISFEDGIILGRKIWNLDHAIQTLQGRHRDMVHFADNLYERRPVFSVDDGIPNVHMPGKENGKWGMYGYSQRTLDRDKFQEFKTLFYEMQGWDTATEINPRFGNAEADERRISTALRLRTGYLQETLGNDSANRR